jgi:hypothetical protein
VTEIMIRFDVAQLNLLRHKNLQSGAIRRKVAQ